jgi:hypothetical protein
MEEKLYTGKVAIDDLEKLIASCHFPEDTRTWVLAEQLPNRVIAKAKERQNLLLFAYFKQDIPFASYTSGRIFREDTELRWEKQESEMSIVYLGAKEYISVLRDYGLHENQEELLKLTAREEPKYYYLFGERLQNEDIEKMGGIARPGDFAQVRIPRLLRYPVPQNTASYVRLKVREYINAATGTVGLFRFQSLEAVEAKE